MGCPVEYLEAPHVVAHERPPSDDTTIHTFAAGTVELVSLPSREDVDVDLDDADIDELIAATHIGAPPGGTIDLAKAQLIVAEDPVTLALADSWTLQRDPTTRRLLVIDPQPAVLDMLRAEVAPIEWREGGGDIAGTRRIGALSGGVLVALATVEPPMGRLARIRVIVSPSYRRRGLGRLVLLALARKALNEGLLPYCRLAMGNAAAHALASTAGFVAFARSLTMRIAPRATYPTTSTSP